MLRNTATNHAEQSETTTKPPVPCLLVTHNVPIGTPNNNLSANSRYVCITVYDDYIMFMAGH